MALLGQKKKNNFAIGSMLDGSYEADKPSGPPAPWNPANGTQPQPLSRPSATTALPPIEMIQRDGAAVPQASLQAADNTVQLGKRRLPPASRRSALDGFMGVPKHVSPELSQFSFGRIKGAMESVEDQMAESAVDPKLIPGGPQISVVPRPSPVTQLDAYGAAQEVASKEIPTEPVPQMAEALEQKERDELAKQSGGPVIAPESPEGRDLKMKALDDRYADAKGYKREVGDKAKVLELAGIDTKKMKDGQIVSAFFKYIENEGGVKDRFLVDDVMKQLRDNPDLLKNNDLKTALGTAHSMAKRDKFFEENPGVAKAYEQMASGGEFSGGVSKASKRTAGLMHMAIAEGTINSENIGDYTKGSIGQKTKLDTMHVIDKMADSMARKSLAQFGADLSAKETQTRLNELQIKIRKDLHEIHKQSSLLDQELTAEHITRLRGDNLAYGNESEMRGLDLRMMKEQLAALERRNTAYAYEQEIVDTYGQSDATVTFGAGKNKKSMKVGTVVGMLADNYVTLSKLKDQKERDDMLSSITELSRALEEASPGASRAANVLSRFRLLY